MSAFDIPDDVTPEQVTAALEALGLGHLESSLQEVHLVPGGVEVVLLRRGAAVFVDDASKVRATIGRRHQRT